MSRSSHYKVLFCSYFFSTVLILSMRPSYTRLSVPFLGLLHPGVRWSICTRKFQKSRPRNPRCMAIFWIKRSKWWFITVSFARSVPWKMSNICIDAGVYQFWLTFQSLSCRWKEMTMNCQNLILHGIVESGKFLDSHSNNISVMAMMMNNILYQNVSNIL